MMTFKTKRNIGIVIIYGLFIGLLASVWWELERVNKAILDETSVVAKGYLDIFESFRALYTSEVVENLNKDLNQKEVIISHDYRNHANAIPLPATMTLMLAEKSSQKTRTFDVSLFSEYPFPWRNNKNLEKTEKETFQKLKANPSKDIISVVQKNGGRFIQVTRADMMLEQCVSCHNAHPNSPKTDWKVGDVRGALSVKILLDQSTSVSRNVLRELMILIVITSILVLLVIFTLLFEEKGQNASS